jgi:hypothetical protein
VRRLFFDFEQKDVAAVTSSDRAVDVQIVLQSNVLTTPIGLVGNGNGEPIANQPFRNC